MFLSRKQTGVSTKIFHGLSVTCRLLLISQYHNQLWYRPETISPWTHFGREGLERNTAISKFTDWQPEGSLLSVITKMFIRLKLTYTKNTAYNLPASEFDNVLWTKAMHTV